MKKLLTITALLVMFAMCAVSTGCSMIPGQTGRSITQTQNFNRCTVNVNTMPSGDIVEGQDAFSDPIGLSRGSAFSPGASISTKAGGDEAQTASAPNTVTPTTTLSYGGAGVPIADAATSLLNSLTGGGGKMTPETAEKMKEILAALGYEKKAVDDCVNGMCGIP